MYLLQQSSASDFSILGVLRTSAPFQPQPPQLRHAERATLWRGVPEADPLASYGEQSKFFTPEQAPQPDKLGA